MPCASCWKWSLTSRSWAKRVTANPDFRFTLKLWQLFTHGTIETRGEARAAGGPEAREWTADDAVPVRVHEPLSVLDALEVEFPPADGRQDIATPHVDAGGVERRIGLFVPRVTAHDAGHAGAD